ncbi:MAG: septum site-determining protein MinC [Bacillota bacterium]
MPQEAVSIKGNKNGLVIYLSPNGEFDELKKGLRDKFESAKGFFEGARVVFQSGKQSFNNVQLEELVRICSQHGLVPEQSRVIPPVEDVRTLATLSNSGHTGLNNSAHKAISTLAPVWSGFSDAEISTRGHLVKRSLRSGQNIIFPGNVIIMGDVNPGAEIFAEGNIVIMGNFLGLAHAGYIGNDDASIMACRFGAGQLRIAREIKIINEPPAKGFLPRLARISGGKIILEDYMANQ